MSTSVMIPKNGSFASKNTNSNFQNWSSFLDDIFSKELPSSLMSNYDSTLSLPKVNIKEDAESFIIEAAAPGLEKSDFQINLENRVLSIAVEKEVKNESEKEFYKRKEFGYSSFKRSFSLPEMVNEEGIKAEYKDGILSISLPKKEEAKQKPARNIEIF